MLVSKAGSFTFFVGVTKLVPTGEILIIVWIIRLPRRVFLFLLVWFERLSDTGIARGGVVVGGCMG